MKKILNSIFCKKRIPILIIFAVLAIVFVMICIMLFPGKSGISKETVQPSPPPVQTPEPEKDTANTPPEVIKPTAEELYAIYSEGFAHLRLDEPNMLCKLSGDIATGTQAKGKTAVLLDKYVHGFPVFYIDASFELPSDVESLELPDSVVGILSQEGSELDTKGAFYGNTTLGTFIASENLGYIGNKAFYGCTSLGTVFLPMKLSHIGNRAFYGCTSLESISIYGNTSIGENAFTGCSSLSDVFLSENVRRVGLGAFEHTPFYDNMTDEFCIVGDVLIKYNGNGGDIVIPDGVRIIADGVFAGRLSAVSVVIPESVEYIGNSAFRSCAKLAKVEFSESNPPVIGVNAFDGCGDDVADVIAPLTVDERNEFYSAGNCENLQMQ